MNGQILYADFYNCNGTNAIMPFYENRRYLQIYTDDYLFDRLQKLYDNIAIFDWNGNFHFFVDNNQLGLAFLYTLFEFQIRKIDVSHIIIERINYYNSKIKYFDYDKIKLIDEKINGKNCLFRYTEKRFADYWTNGNIRFNISTSYNDYDKNIARRDDENTLIYENAFGAKIISEDNEHVTEIQKITSNSQPYYLACFSLELDPKLFVLFSTDACVVIENGMEYITQIKNYFHYIYPNSRIIFNEVEYIDETQSLNLGKEKKYIKRYVYQYQKEYRFILDFNDDKEYIDKYKEYHIKDIHTVSSCIFATS